MEARSGTNAVKALEALKGLQADWDSYEAAPPDPSALKYARDCLDTVAKILGTAYANPIVGPTPEPGVALVWRKPGYGDVNAVFTAAGGRYVVTGRDHAFVAKGAIRDLYAFAVEVLKRHLAL